MSGEVKPKARDGLLTSDHSKRGKRFLAVLDTSSRQVTLLEPWEHAILILCDGSRDAGQIAKLLEQGVEGEPVTLRDVQRCLKFFERERLIGSAGLRREQPLEPPGPRTLAGLQQAYREWHKDPVKTGQILSGLFAPPFMDPGPFVRAGLEPTVALPDEEKEERAPVAVGSMLVLAEAESLLEVKKKDGPSSASASASASASGSSFGSGSGSASASAAAKRDEPETLIGPLAEDTPVSIGPKPSVGEVRDALTSGAALVAPEEFEPDLDQDVAQLLAQVDLDFIEAESRDSPPPAKKKAPHVPPPVGKAVGGEAKLPPAGKDQVKPASKVVTTTSKPDQALIETLERIEIRKVERPPTHRVPQLSESALRPTMVGLPPAEGAPKDAPPVLVVPPRNPTPKPMTRASTLPDQKRAWEGDDGEQTMRLPTARAQSDITPGAIIRDVSSVADGPTEGMIVAFNPMDGPPDEHTERKPRPRKRAKVESPTKSMRSKEESDPSLELNLPSRAREVFDRLRKAGLRARTNSEEGAPVPSNQQRRKDDENARAFDEALKNLSAGELDVALQHFKRLLAKMPESRRLAGFIEAIEFVGGDVDAVTGRIRERASSAQKMLDEFEGVLEEAVAYGRCPACFSMVAKNFTSCFACGFTLAKSS